MFEIHIENKGYSVPEPVFRSYMKQQEEIRLLRSHLEAEKAKNTTLQGLYSETCIQLHRLSTADSALSTEPA